MQRIRTTELSVSNGVDQSYGLRASCLCGGRVSVYDTDRSALCECRSLGCKLYSFLMKCFIKHWSEVTQMNLTKWNLIMVIRSQASLLPSNSLSVDSYQLWTPENGKLYIKMSLISKHLMQYFSQTLNQRWKTSL